jgi:hypothetical protein
MIELEWSLNSDECGFVTRKGCDNPAAILGVILRSADAYVIYLFGAAGDATLRADRRFEGSMDTLRNIVGLFLAEERKIDVERVMPISRTQEP